MAGASVPSTEPADAPGTTSAGHARDVRLWAWLVAPVVVGGVVGLIRPTTNLPEPWDYLSSQLGWSYFVAW